MEWNGTNYILMISPLCKAKILKVFTQCQRERERERFKSHALLRFTVHSLEALSTKNNNLETKCPPLMRSERTGCIVVLDVFHPLGCCVYNLSWENIVQLVD